MIDQATIARITEAADIVDVVKEFVTLRKAGVNYKGLCPFHDEKTPSFVVSPTKQLCKCFSCGKGGNAVHFIMEHEQLSYPEALKWLARKYGIEVRDRELTDKERAQATRRESMFVINEWARDYFTRILNEDVDGIAMGKAYFRQRGFRDDIIRKFQLGYALPARDAFAHAALGRGFTEELLLTTGLCYKTEDGRIQDRYHGRVIFPVHTVSGKVVAFGGRILSTEKKAAKYVNSPESEIYSKSHELYGLYFAKSEIVKKGRCFLVEGYTDVISMHQSGISNVVASSGTSLTPGQIRLLHRFTDNVTVLYDGDNAGIRASIRGIDMLLSEGINVSVLLLPDGDDPDSFARKHPASEFQEYIDRHQVDFIRFKVQLLMDESGRDPIKRATLVSDVVRSIAVIPNPVVRQCYIQECTGLLGVDESLLVHEVGQQLRHSREQLLASIQQLPPTSTPENNPSTTSENPAVTPHGTTATHNDTTTESTQVDTDAHTASQPGFTTFSTHNAFNHTSLLPYERQLAEALVRYADLPLTIAGTGTASDAANTQCCTVGAYIASELEADGLALPTPLYRTLLEEGSRLPLDANGKSLTYFLSHADGHISKMAAQIGADDYPLCKTQQTGFTPDRERLHELIPRILHDYKHAVLLSQLQSLLQQLRDPAVAKDPDRYTDIMQQYKELYDIEKEFARYLGERVVNARTKGIMNN